jgi:hypothetical protein
VYQKLGVKWKVKKKLPGIMGAYLAVGIRVCLISGRQAGRENFIVEYLFIV